MSNTYKAGIGGCQQWLFDIFIGGITKFEGHANLISDTQWNLVGYARVSTDDQNLDLQLQALRKHGVRESAIYREHVSGVAKRRPEFEACLDALRPGDVLVIWKLDRLGRDLGKIVSVAASLKDRNIQLRSLTENIDTTTGFGNFFFHLMAAMAQLERDLISERTKAGIAAKKEREKWTPGRRPSITPAMWDHLRERVKEIPTPSINELRKDPKLVKLGWPGATKPPARSTINANMEALLAGADYPENWARYIAQIGSSGD